MKLIFALLFVAMAGQISAATCEEYWNDPALIIDDNIACLSWSVPTQNADASPLTDLAGYRIYYGNNSDTLDQVVDISNAEADGYNLDIVVTEATTYYFAITAYDTSGNESVKSDQVSKVIRFVDNVSPEVPGTFRVQMRIRVTVPGGELQHP